MSNAERATAELASLLVVALAPRVVDAAATAGAAVVDAGAAAVVNHLAPRARSAARVASPTGDEPARAFDCNTKLVRQIEELRSEVGAFQRERESARRREGNIFSTRGALWRLFPRTGCFPRRKWRACGKGVNDYSRCFAGSPEASVVCHFIDSDIDLKISRVWQGTPPDAPPRDFRDDWLRLRTMRVDSCISMWQLKIAIADRLEAATSWTGRHDSNTAACPCSLQQFAHNVFLFQGTFDASAMVAELTPFADGGASRVGCRLLLRDVDPRDGDCVAPLPVPFTNDSRRLFDVDTLDSAEYSDSEDSDAEYPDRGGPGLDGGGAAAGGEWVSDAPPMPSFAVGTDGRFHVFFCVDTRAGHLHRELAQRDELDGDGAPKSGAWGGMGERKRLRRNVAVGPGAGVQPPPFPLVEVAGAGSPPVSSFPLIEGTALQPIGVFDEGDTSDGDGGYAWRQGDGSWKISKLPRVEDPWRVENADGTEARSPGGTRQRYRGISMPKNESAEDESDEDESDEDSKPMGFAFAEGTHDLMRRRSDGSLSPIDPR